MFYGVNNWDVELFLFLVYKSFTCFLMLFLYLDALLCMSSACFFNVIFYILQEFTNQVFKPSKSLSWTVKFDSIAH